jgi:hypothetical protein
MGQHPVHRGQAHVLTGIQQRLVDVLGTHVLLILTRQDGQDA